MIVSCPNCVTKYNLPDDKVPADGIKVKCSKCSHLFKVTPPPVTPEEEVEVLLDESNDTEPEQDQSSDFDAAFEEAVSGGSADDNLDDALEDDLTDDLSDDDLADDSDDDDLSDMVFGDDASDDDKDDGSDDDFGIDDDDDDDEDDDFGIDDDDDDDDDSGPDLDLGGENGLFSSLDEDDDAGDKKKGAGKWLLTLLLILLLIVVAAIATLNMKLWTMPQSMQDAIPFDISMITGGDDSGEDMSGDTSGDMADMADGEEPAQPLGDPTERIKDIKPVDFNQYVIGNEVEGVLYVVEGQALNNSATAKKDIKVLVQLFDAAGNEMATREILCGNTLSLFQIQVDDQPTIDENLTSGRGVNLNNSYIKPGEATPFMVVFFGIEGEVETFKITIADAMEATR